MMPTSPAKGWPRFVNSLLRRSSSLAARIISRPVLLLLALVLTVAGVLAARPGDSRAQGAPTVFVESRSAVVGDTFTTDVIAVVPDSASITAFELIIGYDAEALAPGGLQLPQGWAAAPAPGASAAGKVQLAGTSSGGTCQGPGSCTLATLVWQPLGDGDTSLPIEKATLSTRTGTIPVSATSAGLIHVTPPSLATNGDSSAARVGGANVGVLLSVALLAGGALAIPLVAAIRFRRRRSLRRAAQPSTPVLDLAAATTEYLADLELAGRLFSDADALLERMARETSLRREAE